MGLEEPLLSGIFPVRARIRSLSASAFWPKQICFGSLREVYNSWFRGLLDYRSDAFGKGFATEITGVIGAWDKYILLGRRGHLLGLRMNGQR